MQECLLDSSEEKCMKLISEMHILVSKKDNDWEKIQKIGDEACRSNMQP